MDLATWDGSDYAVVAVVLACAVGAFWIARRRDAPLALGWLALGLLAGPIGLGLAAYGARPVAAGGFSGAAIVLALVLIVGFWAMAYYTLLGIG
jgi:NhaP-type Na+/H+ and K+/H+ antiporter